MKTIDHEGTIADVLNQKDGSIFLRVQPTMTDGAWDGGVDLSLLMPDGSPLSESDQSILTNIALCIGAAVPLYEQHDDILAMAKGMLTEAYSNTEGEYLFETPVEAESTPEPQDRVLQREGNVVKVVFNRGGS